MTNAYKPGAGFTLRSHYGERTDPINGKEGEFHSGQDFAAKAGTPIPTAASGTVVYSGYNNNLGNVVIVRNHTGEYSLYGHMLDGSRARVGQRIWPGDTIGLVGSTGARTTGSHLHYSVIAKEAGEKITGTGEGGPIGISLNKKTTMNPAEYDNYDPTPRYLDETMRAQKTMFGTDAGMASGSAPPDRQNSFDDRFEKWATAPARGAPQPPSDRPESFDNRFERWGSVPVRSPVLRELEKYRRSAAPDGPASASVQGTPPATSAFHPDALTPGRSAPNWLSETSTADQSKGMYPPGSNDSPDADMNGSAPSANKGFRYLGRRIAGGAPASVFDTGAPAVPFVHSAHPNSMGGLPGLIAAVQDIDSESPTRAAPPPQAAAAPEIINSKPVRYVSGAYGNNSPASAFESSGPAARFVLPGSLNSSDGIADWIAALAGVNPQNPRQLAPSPQADQLRGFYLDDPMQPWLLGDRR